jgi:hypothetical protein
MDKIAGVGVGCRRDRRTIGGSADGVGRVRQCVVRHRPPGHRPSACSLAQGDPDRDPRQPRTERAVASPGRQRLVGGHECFLGRILGRREVAEDPLARADDGRTFRLDQASERLPVAIENGLDDRALVEEGVMADGIGCRADG